MKKKVLILAGIPWNTTIQRHHKIAEFLMRQGYDVYFVEKIPSSSFTFSKFKAVLLKRENTKMDVPTKGITICKERFVNPHGGLFNYYNKKAVQNVLQQINFKVDLVITYLPINTTFLFLKELEYRALIYDCVRDFQNWGGYPKNIGFLEDKLLEKSDLILTDSYYLTKKISKKVSTNKIIQFLPDVDDESAAILSTATIEKEIKKIVYFGAVSQHIDYQIFNILSNLNYEIHLIGSVDIKIQEKLSEKIICHGFVNNLEQLAKEICRLADAIIIPYKGNMDGVIPAKLMQCIVTGLPIFINNFYDSRQLNTLLYVYNSQEALIDLLNAYNYEEHKQKALQMKEYYENYLKRNDFSVILEKIKI